MKPKAIIFQNAEGEGPGILEECLKTRGWEWKIIHLYLEEEIPTDWSNSSLLVVMGGPMNVYEEDTYPFLREETQTIRMALDNGLPVMGFCLGAQLMTKALGARVVKGHTKEIGWYPVQITEQGQKDPLLSPFPKQVTVFQWHEDTFHLPAGALRLFGSENYLNQAMRIGDMNYGFQFHFEITNDMIEQWIRSSGNEIDEMGGKALADIITGDAQGYLPNLHTLAKSFFDNYLHMVEDHQRLMI